MNVLNVPESDITLSYDQHGNVHSFIHAVVLSIETGPLMAQADLDLAVQPMLIGNF